MFFGECIAFKLNHYDTHKCYNEKSEYYTFPITSHYILRDQLGRYYETTFKAGETIKTKEVISAQCGVFFMSAEKEIKK